MKSKSKRKIPGVATSVIPSPTADPAKDKPGPGPGPDPTRPGSSGPGPGPGPAADKADQAGPGRGGPRPGAGRPPKVPPKIPEFTKAGLARLWQLAFGMIAVRKDDEDWQIDDDEAGNLAEATDPVLRQYLPLIGDHAALVALGITLALTVGPRYALDQAKRRKAKAEKTEKTDQDRPAVKIISRTRSKTKGPKAG